MYFSETDDDHTVRSVLRNVYDDYMIALDDLDFDAWISYFEEDCHYRIVSAENYNHGLPLSTMECYGIGMLRDRVAAIKETLVFGPRIIRRMTSTLKVERHADEFSTRCNFVVYESIHDAPPRILLVGRSFDRLVNHGSSLRFRQRICVYDNHHIPTSLIYPV